jgi:hypothetical protein
MASDVTTASAATPAQSHSRLVLRASTVCVVAVTLINLAVYGLGRMTDASFVVSPGLLPEDLQVGALKVAVTTLAYFAPGVVLLVVAARRSLRWVHSLAWVAVVYALASTWGPLAVAQDPATGWVLATMHGTTGAAFVVAASWVHRRIAARQGTTRPGV